MIQKYLNSALLSEDNVKERFYIKAALNGIRNAKKDVKRQISALKLELSGIPEKGLFDIDLKQEKLNKIKELEELL